MRSWAIGVCAIIAVQSCVLDFDKFEGDATSGTGATGTNTTSCTGGDGGSGGFVPASCTDGQLGGGESDVDCGGECPGCSNGKNCGQYDDCVSLFCNGTTCAACAGDADCAAANGWCDTMQN